jgi:hypothetical protein
MSTQDIHKATAVNLPSMLPSRLDKRFNAMLFSVSVSSALLYVFILNVEKLNWESMEVLNILIPKKFHSVMLIKFVLKIGRTKSNAVSEKNTVHSPIDTRCNQVNKNCPAKSQVMKLCNCGLDVSGWKTAELKEKLLQRQQARASST